MILSHLLMFSVSWAESIPSYNELPVRPGTAEFDLVIAEAVNNESLPMDLAPRTHHSEEILDNEFQYDQALFGSASIVGPAASEGLRSLSKILRPNVSFKTSNGKPVARTQVEIEVAENARITLIQKFRKTGTAASGMITLSPTKSCQVETWAPVNQSMSNLEVTLNCSISEATFRELSPAVTKVKAFLVPR